MENLLRKYDKPQSALNTGVDQTPVYVIKYDIILTIYCLKINVVFASVIIRSTV